MMQASAKRRHRRILTVLLLVWGCTLSSEAAGLPGGGTSLHISSDEAVAILPEFTALAGLNTFSFEFWFNAFLVGEMGFAVELVTAEDIQLFSINIYEG